MTLEEWLTEYRDEIDQSRAFALSERAWDPAHLDEDLRRSRRDYARMGVLLSQAETFVAQAEAAATHAVKVKFQDASAAERRVFAKADDQFRKVCEIRDDLQIIVSALNKMHYELMNFRKTALDRGVSGDS